MTTVKITLPDQLAQDAQRAGLLSQAALEKLLREQLQTQRQDGFFAAMERMEQVTGHGGQVTGRAQVLGSRGKSGYRL